MGPYVGLNIPDETFFWEQFKVVSSLRNNFINMFSFMNEQLMNILIFNLVRNHL